MKIELCKYKGGASSAFSFTFDDGCYYDSSCEVLENFKSVYKKYGVKFKATVGITVNFMNDALVEFWKNATRGGYFDISSHSVGHDIAYNQETPLERREEDAKESKRLLKELFDGEEVDTFIYPGGSRDEGGIQVLKDYYIAARGNTDGINRPGEIDWLDVKCFTAMLKRPLNDYTDYIDEVIASGGWGVQMNHWITHKAEDTFHSQSANTFADECDYLGKRASKNDVWVGSFNEVARYIRQYEKCKLCVKKNDEIYTASLVDENGKTIEKNDTPLTICLYTDQKICLLNDESEGITLSPKNGKIFIPIRTSQRFYFE